MSRTSSPFVTFTFFYNGRTLLSMILSMNQFLFNVLLLLPILTTFTLPSGIYATAQGYSSPIHYDQQHKLSASSSNTLIASVPTLMEVFDEVMSEPGRFVLLKCVATGHTTPQITWSRDGVKISVIENADGSLTSLGGPSSGVVGGANSDTTTRDYLKLRLGIAISSYVLPLSHIVVSSLNISQLQPDDGGLYGCEASNTYGSSVDHRRRLNVFGKPIARPMSDVKAFASQTVSITCSFAGYPIDSITWHRDSHQLPVNKRQEVFENGTLILHDVPKSTDDGQYTCRVSSNSGQAHRTVRLIIMVAPAIEAFTFTRGIRQGQRTRLVCSITQGDPPFEFLWFKDGRRLDPAALSLGVRSDGFSSDLTFARATPRHNGNYTCTVRNDVATVSHSASLVVDVPPYWRVEPTDKSYVAGDYVLIDCLAEGVPPPAITWERATINAPRYYTRISSGPHFEIYGNGSLLVKQASEEDGAFYSCQASNTIGPGLSKVIRLIYHVPPRFLLKFQSEAVRLGEEALLKCEADGELPMTITWFVNKEPIAASDENRYQRTEEIGERSLRSFLKIQSVKRVDSALFTCFVNNTYGDDEMNMRLIVHEVPDPPRDVKLVSTGTRSATMSWQAAFNGNNQITKYWITCHPRDIFDTPATSSNEVENDHQMSNSLSHVNITVDSVAAEEGMKTVVRGLRPTTIYYCTVRAENDIGLSSASTHIEVKTEEEVLSVSLKITSSSFSTAEVTLERKSESSSLKEVENELAIPRGYELYYRILKQNSTNNSEWQVKPLPAIVGQHRNQTTVIENLVCGSSYQAYIIELESGIRSETITFRTLGSAPVAPKQSDVIKLVSDPAILVLPSAWDQANSCPIVKLTTEYRNSGTYTWRLLATRTPPAISDIIEISHLQSPAIYTVKMTAYTAAGPPTLVEYDVRVGMPPLPPGVGIDEADSVFYGGGSSVGGLQRTLFVDQATLVSLISSCLVLIAGFIAIVCIIIYKRNSQRKMVSASSSMSVASRNYGQHYRRPSGNTTSSGLTTHSEASLGGGGAGGQKKSTTDKVYHHHHSQPSLSHVPMGGKKAPLPSIPTSVPPPPPTTAPPARSSFTTTGSPLRGKLPVVAIPRKQLDDMEQDIYNEYDEITPYATSRMTDADNDANGVGSVGGIINADDEFRTFTVKIGEPAYMMKGSMDGMPSTSRDFKSGGLTFGCAKEREDALYHCSQMHTIQSNGSSTHTELLRAYEYGRCFTHRVQTHEGTRGGGGVSRIGGGGEFYNEEDELGTIGTTDASLTSDGAETPTDPGIRQFTKSPPRPNEQRIGGCYPSGGSGGGVSQIDRIRQQLESMTVTNTATASDTPDQSSSTGSSSSSSDEEEVSSSSAAVATTPTNERQTAFDATPREHRSRKQSKWSASGSSGQVSASGGGRVRHKSAKQLAIDHHIDLIGGQMNSRSVAMRGTGHSSDDELSTDNERLPKKSYHHHRHHHHHNSRRSSQRNHSNNPSSGEAIKGQQQHMRHRSPEANQQASSSSTTATAGGVGVESPPTAAAAGAVVWSVNDLLFEQSLPLMKLSVNYATSLQR